MTSLILASTSVYRQNLLRQLMVEFTAKAPLCDEDSLKKNWNLPLEMAQNLAFAKAQSLANEQNCVIGGDQLVELEGEILGKAKSVDKAIEQLKKMQGKTHRLVTAVCVFYRGRPHPLLDLTEMTMKPLTENQIKSYIQKDNPIDCAGSYKIEQHGLALFEKINCQDFTAIQGLPLIALSQLLQKLEYQIPGEQK